MPAGEGTIVVLIDPWYGGFLVERVEGFVTEVEWRRAYREINEFERVLVDWDSSGELLPAYYPRRTAAAPPRSPDRFGEAMETAYEDFRNRARWSEYEPAIEDMMAETSTKRARWHLIGQQALRPYRGLPRF